LVGWPRKALKTALNIFVWLYNFSSGATVSPLFATGAPPKRKKREGDGKNNPKKEKAPF